MLIFTLPVQSFLTLSVENDKKNKSEDVHSRVQFGPLKKIKMLPQRMVEKLTPTQLHYTAASETPKFV